MILPTAYLAPTSWFRDYLREPATFEVLETFEKQTFRNRCLIHDKQGEVVRLTVPVAHVEHKQFTQDIRISYQQRWQHQHWMALVSAYEHTPYFDYYADYFRPFYEHEIPYLIDLNEGLTEVIDTLLHNNVPNPSHLLSHQEDSDKRGSIWHGLTWTDSHPWQSEISIVDALFEHGPSLIADLLPAQ